ncbi:LOW QUALITY PROTEIN: hypothetical protein PHMEG_00020775 [Phytophthora megakarya]|uniref:CCHC-type domain-containing protein n=1 Tax=Phytophthora megakarya TaxID=4795 RepID=A0A225VQ56_9STRA|nr:LOW QUALITY PROTEIN: hypothetical protein PHMEG_00020775 [Phytophthora megakarya]
MAMMVSNLRGQAIAWFTTQQKNIVSISELATALRKECIPVDLQERLRDKYELDQITLFVRGLVSRTREEVQYRRCGTVSEAVSVAMEYERTHMAITSHSRTKQRQQRGFSDGPEPMEIGNTRFMVRSECMRRNLCFCCKRPGHRMRDCRSGGDRTSPQQAPRRPYRYGNSQWDNVQKIQQSNFEEKPCTPLAPLAQIGASADTTELLFDHLTVNATAIISATRTESSLVRKEGMVSLYGTPVTILLDSGADHNVKRCGLADTYAVSVSRLNVSMAKTTDDVKNEVEADNCKYKLSPSHDVIFGAPWFAKYNPDIGWVTHEMYVPEPDVDYDQLDAFISKATSSDLGIPISALENAFDGQHIEAISSAQVEEQRPVTSTISPRTDDVLVEFEDLAPQVLPNILPPTGRLNLS